MGEVTLSNYSEKLNEIERMLTEIYNLVDKGKDVFENSIGDTVEYFAEAFYLDLLNNSAPETEIFSNAYFILTALEIANFESITMNHYPQRLIGLKTYSEPIRRARLPSLHSLIFNKACFGKVSEDFIQITTRAKEPTYSCGKLIWSKANQGTKSMCANVDKTIHLKTLDN